MDLATEGADWPNRGHSRMVASRPHRWHVQEAGTGPDLLLLHGTGASTHSWAGMWEALARERHLVAPDLPGHGFTRSGARQRSRPGTMAADLWSLMGALERRPRTILAHSAGVALALNMATMPDRPHDIDTIVGINGALDGFEGAAGWLFPMVAKAIAAVPGLTSAMAGIAGRGGRSGRILTSTGSDVPAREAECYARLMADPAHIDGALSMMAQWSTRGLPSMIEGYGGRLVLLTADDDPTVPPEGSRKAAAQAPDGHHVALGPGGHLIHEARPELVVEAILGIPEDP